MRALIPIVVAIFLSVLLPPTPSAGAGQERTWNFEQAAIPGAQVAGNWGAGVTVAVLDTWVDFRHPDLEDRIVGHAVCLNSANGCHDNTYAKDRCGHGTHVAGTVASGRYGVAPRAGVLAVQVLSWDAFRKECNGSTEDVARGIRFAVGKGADIINLSLGTLVPGLFSSDAVAAAVHDAARAGVVVVFAAGNNTVPISENYGSDALIVAATGPDGTIASYSTRGDGVSLAAPGGDEGAAGLNGCGPDTCIMSTLPDNSYGLLEGTSMAAPHVSGVAALLLSEIPGRGRDDVLTSMRSTARPLAGAGAGLIDATAALRLRKAPPQVTSTVPAPNGGPGSATSQRTRLPRPSDQPEVPGLVAGSPSDGPGSSRSVTFPRATTSQPPGGEGAPGVPDQQQGPPADRAAEPPAEGSGLPLMVVWGGLAAAGGIGVLWSVLVRRRILGRHD